MASYYLQPMINHAPRAAAVRRVVRAIRGLEFDAIAFRGLSGAMMGTLVAHKLHKPVIAVRKGEITHGDSLIEFDPVAITQCCEGWAKYNLKYVIVDDLIASGATVSSIRSAIATQMPNAKCVAVVCYYTDPKGKEGLVAGAPKAPALINASISINGLL